MQHSAIRQASKTLLTITGILLLIIFGARAASQATSLAAVGGQAKKASLPLFAQPLEVALRPSDSHRWFARQVTTTSDTIEPQAAPNQTQAPEQGPAPADIKASVNKIATVIHQETQRVTNDSIGVTTGTQNSVYHSAGHDALQQNSKQLLDKSRQN